MKKFYILPLISFASLSGAIVPLVSCGQKPQEDDSKISFETTGKMIEYKKGYIELDWTPSDNSLIISNPTFKYGDGTNNVIASIDGDVSSRPLTINLTFTNGIDEDITNGQLSFHYENITTSKQEDATINDIKIDAFEPDTTGLYFEDVNSDGDSTIGYTINGSLPNIKIQISEDCKEWQDWDGQDKTISDGQKLYVRNINSTLSIDSDNYFQFKMDGKVKASGNINSLINYLTTLSDDCYTCLFTDCESLANINQLKLPTESLTKNCYKWMFSGCTNLTSLPNNLLPATGLADDCYYGMFSNCLGLSTLPKNFLSAQSLATSCYEKMFEGCEHLTSLPSDLLPAQSLADSCYKSMFNDCKALTSLPKGLLPAQSLATSCYEEMFKDCIHLFTLHNILLPAQTLADRCYKSMFNNCNSLTSLPIGLLPAQSLATSCYEEMFEDCTDLLFLPDNLLPAQTLADSCYKSMFNNCSSLNISNDVNSQGSAFFNCPSQPFPESAIQDMFANTKQPPTMEADKTYYCVFAPLCFEDLNPNGDSTIGYKIQGSLSDIQIQTSENGVNWENWDGQAKTISDGQKLYVRNTNNTLSVDWNRYFSFTMAGSIKASGTVNGMINYQSLSECCFGYLFLNCSSLVNIDELILPSKELSNNCYVGMFSGCSGLISLPSNLLPAINLTERCYCDMFKGCKGLIEIPNGFLPSTNLADSCYRNMFYECNKLSSLPENLLPATQLKDYCYNAMFYNCSSLKISQEYVDDSIPFFTCPSTIPTSSVSTMFMKTGGTYKSDPIVNTTYYCY